MQPTIALDRDEQGPFVTTGRRWEALSAAQRRHCLELWLPILQRHMNDAVAEEMEGFRDGGERT